LDNALHDVFCDTSKRPCSDHTAQHSFAQNYQSLLRVGFDVDKGIFTSSMIPELLYDLATAFMDGMSL
jgi:hypothetical protein